MKNLVFLATIFSSACAVEDPSAQLYDYSCVLDFACGQDVQFVEVHWCGQYEEVKELSSSWADACRDVTLESVIRQDCPFVVCAVFCLADNAVPVDSCEGRDL